MLFFANDDCALYGADPLAHLTGVYGWDSRTGSYWWGYAGF